MIFVFYFLNKIVLKQPGEFKNPPVMIQPRHGDKYDLCMTNGVPTQRKVFKISAYVICREPS